ncbi:MAG TPA: hypothetical protein VE570_01060, partial [Thermoleophilaceae bacterium]|nr:hypothetical protein [Thermoleophilaceae bacterium]
TSLLYTIAVTMVIFGALLVASAWLTGHTQPAVEARRRLAPVLRDRPVLVYGSVACVYLLVLVWGPTPAFRNLIPILLIAGLIVLGVETLRHQTAREFPGEMPGRVGPPTPGAPPGAPALGHG